VEHPKFEVHVTSNNYEYKKYVWLNLDIVLEYDNSPSVFWLHAYRRKR